MSQFENIAFISYKREDEKWARWMQRKLEYYKLPSEAKKLKNGAEFLNNPRHVFKDTTDLSGGVLAQSIKRGLDSSKFLIVICSPRAAQSPWVCKEVQEFIDSGREQYIIPFIVEGEPNSSDPEAECFPAALRLLSGERELLGININENNRDYAFVKVISRIFDIRFDILWNRFQREARRRTRLIVAAVSVLILVLLGIIAAGGWSYQKIKSQQVEIIRQRDNANQANTKLSAANVSLSAANDSITNQKAALQQMFNDLQQSQANLAQSNAQLKTEKDNVLQRNYMLARNNAVLTAKEANNMIDDGNILGAITLLQTIIPDPSNPNEHPYDIELEQVMRKTLLTYNSSKYKSIGTIDSIGFVCDVAYNPNGTLIATAGEDGYVRLWNASSGKYLYSLPRQNEAIYNVFFDDENSIILSNTKSSKKYNISTHQFTETNTPAIIQDKYSYSIQWWNKNRDFEDTVFYIDKERQLMAKKNGMLQYSDLSKGQNLTCYIDTTDRYPFSHFTYDIAHNRIGISDVKNHAYIWNLDFLTIDTVTMPSEYIRRVALSPTNNDIVTTSREGLVRIWHKGEGEAKQVFDRNGENLFAISDNKVAVLNENNYIYYYDFKTNQVDSMRFFYDFGDEMYDFYAWSYNKKESLIISVEEFPDSCPVTAHIHNALNMKLVDETKIGCPLFKGTFLDGSKDGFGPQFMGFDENGQYAYSVIMDKLFLWNIQDGKFGKCIYSTLVNSYNTPAFTEDSKLFACYIDGEEKSICVVDLKTLTVDTIETGELNDVVCMKFIDNENIMFQTNSVVAIVNLPTRQITHRYISDNLSMSVSDYCKQNDQIIACSGDILLSWVHNIYVWDRKSENLLYTIPNVGVVDQMRVYGKDLYVMGGHGVVKYRLPDFSEVKQSIKNFIPYRSAELYSKSQQ